MTLKGLKGQPRSILLLLDLLLCSD